MLALPQYGFVWLSMPKCASTAVEEVLRPHAKMTLRGDLKHTTYRGFHYRVEPVLAMKHDRSEYEVVSLFREPISWLESWWRYRSRPSLRGTPRWTGEMPFAQFVSRYVERDPSLERLKGQARFVARDGLETGIDRIFRFESPQVWQQWLRARTGKDLDFGQRNVSPTAGGRPTDLDPGLRRAAEQLLAPEYDLYGHLEAEGQWAPPTGYLPTGVTAGEEGPDRYCPHCGSRSW